MPLLHIVESRKPPDLSGHELGPLGVHDRITRQCRIFEVCNPLQTKQRRRAGFDSPHRARVGLALASGNVAAALPELAANPGLIGRGKLADLGCTALDDLAQVRTVMVAGRVVAPHGRRTVAHRRGPFSSAPMVARAPVANRGGIELVTLFATQTRSIEYLARAE